MLTGVRGVGKTTTARLIARALNCVGPDGTSGPTMSPCGICDSCVSIGEDRHPDVIEMDAASRTGVDDVRDLIESVQYRPVSARYKIYIIDEVHMLSKPAFNALLKTLEEPPPDVKFVFATTEINKVPVTVLSRCQRYTLPRIPLETLARYYGEIAQKEGVEIEAGALALIARAADGSVRDGLSILDQAIALSFGGAITSDVVRNMLGVADRGLTFDLFEALMAGDAAASLGQLENFYNGGTDPAMVLQELLEVTHLIMRLKVTRPADAAAAAAPLADGQDRERALAFAQRLGVAALSRGWQILLKGLAEVQSAPSPLAAAEMVLVRLIYVSDLPPPAELLKALREGEGGLARKSLPAQPGGPGPRAEGARQTAPSGKVATATSLAVRPESESLPGSLEALMVMIAAAREGILYSQVASFVHLVRYEPGLIEFRPAAEAPRDLASRLGRFLQDQTGTRWVISVSREQGDPSFREQEEAKRRQALREVEEHPLIKAAMTAFPGARIERIVKVLDQEANQHPQLDSPRFDETPLPALYEEDDPGPFTQAVIDADPDDDGEIGDKFMKNFGNMMKQAQQMQERMQEMQAQLDQLEVTGSSGGGLVSLVLNGKGNMKKVSIDKTLFDPDDSEVLEDLIVAAFNDAKAKVETHTAEQMSKLTGGLSLPPGLKLPF